ncbi:MAG: hypothetical protein RIS12_654, partial [Bacteroidota bacterium]
MVRWSLHQFGELTPPDLYELLTLRSAVFV